MYFRFEELPRPVPVGEVALPPRICLHDGGGQCMTILDNLARGVRDVGASSMKTSTKRREGFLMLPLVRCRHANRRAASESYPICGTQELCEPVEL